MIRSARGLITRSPVHTIHKLGVVLAVAATVLGSPVHLGAQDAPILPGKAPILVALFSGSELRAAAFDYDLTDALEDRIATSDTYDVITHEELRTLLPPGLASTVTQSQQLRYMEAACPRFRQLASAANVSLVLCGGVRALDDGTFEVATILFEGTARRELQLVRGTEVGSVAADISAQLTP